MACGSTSGIRTVPSAIGEVPSPSGRGKPPGKRQDLTCAHGILQVIRKAQASRNEDRQANGGSAK